MPDETAETEGPVDGDRPRGRGAQILVDLGRRGRKGAGAGPRVPGYVIPPGSKIGEGTFSEVYRARDLAVARDVAIKILRRGDRPDEVQQARMENEARALGRLQGTRAGDHIVQIYNRSRSDDGPHYLVLELVEGRSLADRLADRGPMAAVPAASMARTIAEVAHDVHGLGIIHRDLKPSNVLLAPGDQPKLTDFGLARFAGQPEGLTFDGQVLGTPEYMPPEQAAGRLAEVDATSEVYSLGAILYECLTGKPPFRGPTVAETLTQIQSDREPIPPEQLVPSVPRDLSTICLKCLSKARDARYPTAAALADDLGRFLEGRPIAARRAGPSERLIKLIRRNLPVSALIGLVVVSVAVGVAASLSYAREAGRQEVRANKNAEIRFHVQEKVLSAFSGDKLRRAGQGALQDQILKELLPLIEDVFRIEGDDPATRNLQGQAWINLARIRREFGKGPEALEAAGNGEAIFRGLLGVPGFGDGAAIGLGTALSYKGPILGMSGKLDEGIAALDEAAGLLVPHAVEEAPPLLERMGHIHNNLGNCFMRLGVARPGTLEAADRHYREAVRYFGLGARTLPTCRDWQARTLSNLALIIGTSLERPAEAIQLAGQAADLARGLVRDFPNDIDTRDCAATCLTNLAELRMSQGDPAGSLPVLREALALYERLSAQVPDSFEFRWSVAMAASNLGQVLSLGPPGDWPKALEQFRRAELMYKTLAREAPDNQELAGYVATNSQRLAETLRKLGIAP